MQWIERNREEHLKWWRSRRRSFPAWRTTQRSSASRESLALASGAFLWSAGDGGHYLSGASISRPFENWPERWRSSCVFWWKASAEETSTGKSSTPPGTNWDGSLPSLGLWSAVSASRCSMAGRSCSSVDIRRWQALRSTAPQSLLPPMFTNSILLLTGLHSD